jgi:Mg2+ and Co2+ transporter CorA
LDIAAESTTRLDGLLWAVHYPPGGPPRVVSSTEQPAEGWIWTHYDLVHAGASGAIGADPALPDVAKAILTGRDETPRMLAAEELVAGVLPAFTAAVDGTDPDALVGWHFAIQPHRLVTGRRSPVHALQAARSAADRGHAPATPSVLIAEALSDFAVEMRRRVAALAADLDAVEDKLLAPSAETDLSGLGTRIGALRRAATLLRRPIAPVARLLDNDVDDLPNWMAQCAAHDAALRQTLAAIDDLNSLQERARVLQDELAARQAEETNRRLYIVSVVTTLIMPATLVTGFFGMNTGGMYLNTWASGTHFATAICLLALAITWWLMRWRKLL